MADPLANLNPDELAAWYGRLAEKTAERKWGGSELLASDCLRLWLENRTPNRTITVEAPLEIRNSPYVSKALNYHRSVYLTEEKARVESGTKWAGIIPRIQGKGHPKATRLAGINMEYKSLVEIPITAQMFGPSEDKDLLYALYGLQLKTRVTVSCSLMANTSLIQVVFVSFEARLKARYDWNPSQQINVANPDFKSRSRKAVAPNSENIVVYHTNAKRLEEAGFAAPYYLESEYWYVDSSLLAPAQVDVSRKI
jgi:hypothetical protein